MSSLPQPVLLQAWLSPAFPVGSFAYSHALEQAHADGRLNDVGALVGTLRAHVRDGSLRNDAVLLALAWRSATVGDVAELVRLNSEAVALAAGAERRLETTAQGTAFLRAVAASWSVPAFVSLHEGLDGAPVAYPIAFAIATAAHGVELPAALEAYAFAWLANLTSAAARLGAIGQTGAQRTLATLAPELGDLVRRSLAATEDDLGGCALVGELDALRHETLYTRLFRT